MTLRVDDLATDRALQELRRRVERLEQGPAVQALLLSSIDLVDGTEKIVRHGLGRRVTPYLSAPRSPSSTGRIEEVRSAGQDLRNEIRLLATGFGAIISVDVLLV